MRIVSLIPSATEILCALGLQSQLVGVTHECDYPSSVRSIPHVTRTLIPANARSSQIDQRVGAQLSATGALYELDFNALERARPDLIVTQTLCNVCAVSDTQVRDAVCRLPSAPAVICLEPTRLSDVFESVLVVARAARVPDAGRAVVGALLERVEIVRRRSAAVAARRDHRPRVTVLEWLHPPYACGHWTPDLVEIAGAVEPLASAGAKSRRVSTAEISAPDPAAILIACCGFSAQRAMLDVPDFLRCPEIAALRCTRENRVYVTDGNAYFSRPGPRLVESLEILAHVIDPAAHPLSPDLPRPLQVSERSQ